MTSAPSEVWITGLGLASAAGSGVAAHAALLGEASGQSAGAGPLGFDAASQAPFGVHALVPIDVSSQIPSKSEQRQMGVWQRLGVYAAGLALEDAGLKGNAALLDRMDLVVAAGNGERDLALDQRILETLPAAADKGAHLNTALATGLRPTLYLGELSNLLAGNIQIVHKVTGSSRTLKGEELAGVAAVENAVRRIAAGQGELFLVGGALNAERADLLLGYALGGNLWAEGFAPVWQRGSAAAAAAAGGDGAGGAGAGGFIAGSMGAFLVLESRAHAQARGAKPYAKISAVTSDRAARRDGGDDESGAIAASLARLVAQLRLDDGDGTLGVLSGASGVAAATAAERAFLHGLGSGAGGAAPAIRAYGSRLGHGVEAHFPLGVALAALALAAGRFYPPVADASGTERACDGVPERILVTGVGHWRGEGLGLVERVDGAREVE